MSMSQVGNFFEDFAPGQVIRHALGRTVTDADNIWFTGVTHNPNQVHFNADYAPRTAYGKMLVNSGFTLALVTGLTVADLSQNGFNLEWTHVRMPNPLFTGETVYAQSEVLAVRESRSRPQYGIITVHTYGYKQDGTVVIEFERTIMVYKRAHAPQGELIPTPHLPVQ
jgi:acyl dehydratase